MKERVSPTKHTQQTAPLPVHSLEKGSMQINILPLDHSNPYDYKREHRHTYFEIMLIEKGGGNQLIDFINYDAKDNSCYIIFPQQIHLMNRKNSTGTVVQFTEDRISSNELRATLTQLSFFADAAIVFEKQAELIQDLKTILHLLEKTIHATTSVQHAAVSNLLQSFVALTVLYKSRLSPASQDQDKKLLIEFHQLVEKHYFENPGVTHLIQLLGTTDKKLSAATKKFMGLSPLQVIHNRILLEAKRLLLFEETSHKEIAYQLGFDSPASFSAFIKTKTGFSPSELTKQLAEFHK